MDTSQCNTRRQRGLETIAISHSPDKDKLIYELGADEIVRDGKNLAADAEPLSVSLMDLIMKHIRIIGSQQNGPEYLYEALDFVAQGKVKTIVETYPLAEAAKAYERVAEGKARFRAVLTM